MKKQTAMQLMIEKIDAIQNHYIKKQKESKDKDFKKGVDTILTATTIAKIQAKELLTMEKQQIIDAYHKGFTRELGNRNDDSDQYFTETYEDE